MAKFFQAISFNGIPEWEFLNQKIVIKDLAHADTVLEMLICLDFWEMKNVCPACGILQDDLLEHFMIAHVGISFYEVGNDREAAVSALLQENKAQLIPNCWRCYDCGKVTYTTNPQYCNCHTGYYETHLRHLRCPICVQLIRVERYYAHYRSCWANEYYPEACKLCCSSVQCKCAEIVYNAMKYTANRMHCNAVLCPGCWQMVHISDFRSHFTKCVGMVNELSLMQMCEKWQLNCVTKDTVNLGKVKDWSKVVLRPKNRRIEFEIKCLVCPATFTNNENLFLHFFTHKSQPFMWEQLIGKVINRSANLANLLLNMNAEQINGLMLESNSIRFKPAASFKPTDSIVFKAPADSISFKPEANSITFKPAASLKPTPKQSSTQTITFKPTAQTIIFTDPTPKQSSITDRKDLELSKITFKPPEPITFKPPEKKKLILASDIPGDELEEL